MRALGAALAAALLCLAGPRPARADGDERTMSVSLGYARYSIPDYTPSGSALGLEYEHGFADALALRAAAAGGIYFMGDQDDRRSYSALGVVGLTYRFDTIKYRPYVGGGLGGILIDNGARTLKPLVEVAAGLDILHSRSLAYGFQARYETYLKETSYLSVGVRLTWRWGFF